jgi:hypothetical protein
MSARTSNRRGAKGLRAASTALLLALGACGQGGPPGKPAASGPMYQAFEVAFGKPAPYSTIDDGGDRIVYNPQALIDLQPGVVALISAKRIPRGCRSCGGALAINYLRRDPSGFSRLGAWADAGGQGVSGGVLPWTIRTDIDNGPTLVTRRDERRGDCSSTTDELITLAPKGPVKIATVVVATGYAPLPEDHGHPPHVSGAIVPIVRGERFAVVLSGTSSLRQVFRREGDVFTTYSPGATGC